MVHKRAIILIVVAIVVCCSALVIGLLSDDEDGVTVASREAILQDLPKGIDWQIASEILIDDYLLSSIYSPTKDGVAIFAPQKKGGYEYQSIHYANKGDIVIAHVITNQSYYDIFYLDQADLSYAEVIYTVDGQQLAPVQLDLVDAKICYHQAPSDDYRLDVRYYDRNGNIYQ